MMVLLLPALYANFLHACVYVCPIVASEKAATDVSDI